MRKLTKKEMKIVEAICDLMADEDIGPQRGEELLCFLAGESCGHRGGNLLEHMKVFAIAYRLGAEG